MEIITADAINFVFEKIVRYPLALVILILSLIFCYKILRLGVYISIIVSFSIAILFAIFFPIFIKALQ